MSADADAAPARADDTMSNASGDAGQRDSPESVRHAPIAGVLADRMASDSGDDSSAIESLDNSPVRQRHTIDRNHASRGHVRSGSGQTRETIESDEHMSDDHSGRSSRPPIDNLSEALARDIHDALSSRFEGNVNQAAGADRRRGNSRGQSAELLDRATAMQAATSGKLHAQHLALKQHVERLRTEAAVLKQRLLDGATKAIEVQTKLNDVQLRANRITEKCKLKLPVEYHNAGSGAMTIEPSAESDDDASVDEDT